MGTAGRQVLQRRPRVGELAEPPTRSVGYVTTGEMTGWSVLRDLIAELRTMRGS